MYYLWKNGTMYFSQCQSASGKKRGELKLHQSKLELGMLSQFLSRVQPEC